MHSIIIILTFALWILSGCGSDPFSSSSGSSSQATNTSTATSTSITTSNQSTGTSVSSSVSANFQGFINSAFELTVDGEKYSDMEDFYTSELSRLPSKVNAAGYDSTWKVAFDAQIGMNDLWRDMKVFISPVSNRGYQGETTVGTAGSFVINLPSNALDSEYRVRATKRLAVVLKRETETVRICYNFSASEKSVLFRELEKPVVLDTFVTAVTAYDCQIADSGMKLPTNPGNTSNPTLKLKKGGSKDEAIAVLGLKNLFVSSPTRWCWGAADVKADICANNSYDRCQCFIEFDDAGKVETQQNIKGELLDLASW